MENHDTFLETEGNYKNEEMTLETKMALHGLSQITWVPPELWAPLGNTVQDTNLSTSSRRPLSQKVIVLSHWGLHQGCPWPRHCSWLPSGTENRGSTQGAR